MGTELASTPQVRTRRRRSEEYGELTTSSDVGSASPPKETETPANGASGATRRKAVNPTRCETSVARTVNREEQTTPSSQAPLSAGTATSSNAVSGDIPTRPSNRWTRPGAGASIVWRTCAHTSSSSSEDDIRATAALHSAQVIRCVSTEEPRSWSTTPATKADSAESSQCQEW